MWRCCRCGRAADVEMLECGIVADVDAVMMWRCWVDNQALSFEGPDSAPDSTRQGPLGLSCLKPRDFVMWKLFRLSFQIRLVVGVAENYNNRADLLLPMVMTPSELLMAYLL